MLADRSTEIADDSGRAGDRSIAGLSATDEARTAPVLGVAPGPRYHEVEVVGEGGLGTVLRARDRFLGREVALKRIGPRARSGSPAEVHDRFLHEARVTARLDHPGIVPVHDAGVTDDGRMFYTMRLIRGRSLAELAARARTADERLALLGPVTAACHAIGYAHRQGVIHRDLKPANIMVGELGETQVVDWGLAEILAERTPSTGFAGTFPYASPEVLHGEPHGIAADVWALGVTLHEVVSGEHRFPGGRTEVERAITAVPLAPARWPADCPPELVAIGERAMAADPADRYVDAHELALDLDAYRDGRRVAAHRYSRGELLRRFVRAWRWPIAATATLAIGTISALALTNHRTETQRVRAVAAESATRHELDRAEAALADSLAARAVASLELGAIADAELSAAQALEHGEHPDARGVLAATRLAPHPVLVQRAAVPGCARLVATGATSALCVERDAVSAWDLAGRAPVRRWTREHRLEQAVAVGDAWLVGWTAGREVLVLAADTGEVQSRTTLGAPVAGVQRAASGERVVLHDRSTVISVGIDGKLVVTEHACRQPTASADEALRPRSIDAIATSDTTTWLVCTGGVLGTLANGELSVVEESGFGSEVSAASALAVSEPGLDVAIANTAGDVMVIDVRGCMSPDCEVGRYMMSSSTTAIRQLAALGGPEVIAIDERGTLVQLRRRSRGDLARIPLDPATPPLFLEGGELVSGGARFSRWRIDPAAVPSVVRYHRGITSAAISADRRVGATLVDDSQLVFWDLTTGSEIDHVQIADAHRVSLSPDGARATVVHARGMTTLNTETAAVISATDIVAEDEHAIAHRAHAVTIGGWEVAVDDVEVTSAVADDRYLAIGTSVGRIDVWDMQRRALVARLRGHVQRITWLAFDHDRLWSAGLDGRLRAWSLAPLDAPVARLASDVRANWGE